MKSAVLDKIASVTRNCRLPREVKLQREFPCREGDVIAVRVLTSKTTYNQLELNTGRFSALRPGDIVAGALGHRAALRGYAGVIPTELAPGDTINVLNIGGVLGTCTSISPDLGQPFECEVLGQILHFPYLGERIGVPANIEQGAAERPGLDALGDIPVIALAGTSMDSGKTCAAAAIIQELRRHRLVVDAAKATGVSLRRDILAMEDAGARATSIFTDFGVVTTTESNAPDLTRAMLGTLAAGRPDVIVLEMGDGLFGTYGVNAVLAAPDIRRRIAALVLCANDPVGAWGGVKCLKGSCCITPSVISGPATDNSAGTSIVTRLTGIPAINARVDPTALGALVSKVAGLARTPAAPVGAAT